MQIDQYLLLCFIINIWSICGILGNFTSRRLPASQELVAPGLEGQTTQLAAGSRIKLRDYLSHHNSQPDTICLQRPPLQFLGVEKASLDTIHMHMKVTYHRMWLQLDVTVEKDCRFQFQNGGDGKQLCCTHLEDNFHVPKETTIISCQILFSFGKVKPALEFKDDDIALNDLPETVFGEIKEKVIIETLKEATTELIDDPIVSSKHSTTTLEAMWLKVQNYGLQTSLPPIFIIGIFLALLFTRKHWGPVLLEKIPILDEWLHPNRLQIRKGGLSGFDSDISLHLVESVNLNWVAHLRNIQPEPLVEEPVHIAEEAVDEMAELASNGTGIETYSHRVYVQAPEDIPPPIEGDGEQDLTDVENDIPEPRGNNLPDIVIIDNAYAEGEPSDEPVVIHMSQLDLNVIEMGEVSSESSLEVGDNLQDLSSTEDEV